MDPATESPTSLFETSDASAPEAEAADAATAGKVGAGLRLSKIDGSNGFVIAGAARNDQSGTAVASGGDVDGDGFADIMVGARLANPNGVTDAGIGYLVFGAKGGFGPTVKLAGLKGGDGFAMEGESSLDWAGESLASAGDINADGFDDMIVAARYADGTGKDYAGRSYVIFGGDGGFPKSIELGDIGGSDGFVLEGAAADDYAGRSVAPAGDVNDDGIDDLIVGANFASPGGAVHAGSAYVVFGRDGGFPAQLSLGGLDGSDGFALNGISAQDQAGRAVAGVGDFNGDRIDDVLVGAPRGNTGGPARAGEAFLVFGREDGFESSLDLGDLDGGDGVLFSGQTADGHVGTSVSAAGDVNGDGLADIVLGAPDTAVGGKAEAGTAYVVFGSKQSLGAEVGLSGLDGGNGFALLGIGEGDHAGYAVSSAGDLNGDGFDDIVIGAYGADPGGRSQAGESYVVFGRGDGNFPDAVDLSTLNGRNGLVLKGIAAGDQSGHAVAGLGDVNRDGFDDLAIGARMAKAGGNNKAGESYVVFGGSDFMPGQTLVGTIRADDLSGNSNKNVMLGLDGGDRLLGRGSADSLYGGDGGDVLQGGAGNDSLYGGIGADKLFGQGGADRLFGNAGPDELKGGNGPDFLDGGTGNDEMIGGNGRDKLYGGDQRDNLVGGAGADKLFGQGGADRLEGGAQSDVLKGGTGGDDLLGGSDNDSLNGGPGPDILTGGGGDDSLTGGNGPDLFVFSPGDGDDVVTDFLSLTDLLDLSEFGFSSAAEVLAATADVGDSAVITLSVSDSVTLDGILKADLDPADFVL